MLLMGAGLAVVGSALLVVSSNVAMIVVASGLGSIVRGRWAGSGGAFRPLYPAEQPLLAASIPLSKRTAAFGTLGAIGVCGGAVGSLVSWVPDALHSGGTSLLSSSA